MSTSTIYLLILVAIYRQGYVCGSCVDGWHGDLCALRCPTSCFSCSNATACGPCHIGFYGLSCDKLCSSGCSDKYCGKWDGKCSPCVEGYVEEYCCLAGTSGEGCNITGCSEHCTSCLSNGTCASCDDGFYGTTCSKHCPATCANIACNKDTGFCDTCSDSVFGNRCDTSCPNQCWLNICAMDGTCQSCNIPYYGDACESVCSEKCGRFGCDQLTGKCKSCLAGFSGDTCSVQCSPNCKVCLQSDPNQCTECADGKYGVDEDVLKCNVDCSSNCKDNVCATHTGNCINVCNSGFTGDTCSDKCPPMCKGATCFQSNGTCETGCESGYSGLRCACQTACTNCSDDAGVCFKCEKKYFLDGQKCFKCPEMCLGNICYDFGECTGGCESGFYGKTCNSICDKHCKGGTCDDADGTCLNGCSEGYVVDDVTCKETETDSPTESLPVALVAGAAGGGGVTIILIVIIIVICVMRRSRRRNKDTPSNNQYDTTNGVTVEDTADVSVEHENVAQDPSNIYAVVNKNRKREQPNTSVEPVQKSVSMTIPNRAYQQLTTGDQISNMEQYLEIDDDDKPVDQNHSSNTKDKVAKDGSYYNTAKIPVSKLAAHVAEKDSGYFKLEFEKFPYGLKKEHKVSQTKANLGKNRYKGIYPYDGSRVKVQGGDTDYINASFIDGYRKKNAYIASLGPTVKQMQDFGVFWRMVWQQRVEKIVMLTNLVEESKPKCDQYWPDIGKTREYSGISVTCHSDDVYADFTLRAFTLSKGKEKRALHQLHFTAWPDRGVPEDVTGLIEFRQKDLGITATLGGPELVHCSAGIGRTGTYIGLDILTKEGETEKTVDIPRCVRQMRQNRPNMVQTSEQYHFLYDAMVHSLTFNNKPIKGEVFQMYVTNLGQGQLSEQFQKLQSTGTRLSPSETDAVRKNRMCVGKNREYADIPGDAHRPLLYMNRQPGTVNYINAVYINSFKTKRRYIVAQSPLPGTVLDFLSLIFQENCCCIVSFESDTNQDVGTYYPPDNQGFREGTFSVSSGKTESKNYFVQRNLKITHHEPADKSVHQRTVAHFQFTDWNADKNVPNSASGFLYFINHVEKSSPNCNDAGPVLIHCLDGAGKSGLFCVVSVLLQKMEIEHEVSVVNTVRQVKSRRPLAIPNEEQFEFCHICISEYLQSFDMYSNFASRGSTAA